MNRNSLCLIIVLLMLTACAKERDEVKKQKLLRHVVLFKFKDETPQDRLKAIEDSFRALPGKIKEIHDFEWGTDVSVENKHQGFTHCFLVSFTSEKARDIYLPHPAHGEFRKIMRPHLDRVLVVDYWASR